MYKLSPGEKINLLTKYPIGTTIKLYLPEDNRSSTYEQAAAANKDPQANLAKIIDLDEQDGNFILQKVGENRTFKLNPLTFDRANANATHSEIAKIEVIS